MSRGPRLVAAALALAACLPALAQSPVDVENERRAKAGLLPRKSPPSKATPARTPPAATVPAAAAPATAAPPLSPAAEATRTQHSAPVPSARPVAPAGPAGPTPMASTPSPAPVRPSGPLEVAIAAARGLSPGPYAGSTLGVDAIPVAVQGLTVKSSVRVRAGRTSLLVESQASP